MNNKYPILLSFLLIIAAFSYAVGSSRNEFAWIEVSSPDAGGAYAGNSYTITWVDSDNDDNAKITLWYSESLGGELNLIASGISEDDESDSYVLDVSEVKEGNYFIRACIDDSWDVHCDWSDGSITLVEVSSRNIELFGPGDTVSNEERLEVEYAVTQGQTCNNCYPSYMTSAMLVSIENPGYQKMVYVAPYQAHPSPGYRLSYGGDISDVPEGYYILSVRFSHYRGDYPGARATKVVKVE